MTGSGESSRQSQRDKTCEVQVSFLQAEPFAINGAKQTGIEDFAKYQGKTFIAKTDGGLFLLQMKDSASVEIRVDSIRLSLENYSTKFIVSRFNTQTRLKEILLELTCTENAGQELRRLLKRRNELLHYKGPLSFNPAEQPRPSLFSSDNQQLDLRGFMNLAFLLIFSSNFMLIVEHSIKYGFLIHQNFASLSLNLTDHGFYLGQLALAALFFSGYYLVMFCYKKKVKYSIKISLQVALILAIILFPIILNKLLKITFFSMIFLNMLTMSAALKLISFLFVANEISNVLKIIEREGVKKDERLKYFKDYSINQENFDLIYVRADLLTIITLKDFFVYTFMPTLCFQLVYPRTDRIRPLNLIKNSFLFIITIMILFYIVGQYIMPIISNSYETYQGESISQKLSLVFRLAFPTSIGWIILFFCSFEFFLNALAEVTYFGDREFYKDWWNCRDTGEYWRLWNLPVHNWFVRHIYNPLIRRGTSKEMAGLFIFFVSALCHEYIISVALMEISFWAFLAMFLQFIAILVEKQFLTAFGLKGSTLGNFAFWISFCILGQPILIIIYYINFIDSQGANSSEVIKPLLLR